MIELLVVIAIIAILAAILFPVFAQAKDSAKKSTCISNLKQIAMATLLYADAHEDCLPMPSDGTYWWGDFTTGLSGGLLYPYSKSGGLKECPSATDLDLANLGNSSKLGYGMNYNVAFGSEDAAGLSFSAFEQPAETVLFGESAVFFNPIVYYVDTLYVGYRASWGKVQGRHGADSAAIAWGDGHVKALKAQYVPFDISASNTSA